MFAFLSRRRPSTVRVNDVEIRANPRETLLHAALRHGIDFPTAAVSAVAPPASAGW